MVVAVTMMMMTMMMMVMMIHSGGGDNDNTKCSSLKLQIMISFFKRNLERLRLMSTWQNFTTENRQAALSFWSWWCRWWRWWWGIEDSNHDSHERVDDDDDDDVDDDDDEQNMELVAVRFPVPAFGCPMCNMKDVSAQFLVAIVIITIVILSDHCWTSLSTASNHRHHRGKSGRAR